MDIYLALNTDDSRHSTSSFSPSMWTGAQALALVHTLNERCIELLAKLAESERVGRAFELVTVHRSLWRDLDATARRRAAQCPFLLVDVHFQSEDWWRWVKEHRSRRWTGHAWMRCFPSQPAGEFMRETLMLVWLTARSDRRAASLLLGLSPAVAELIATLGPHQVERIAAKHSRHLRPRWQDRPAFWRNLLVAARNGDRDSLYDVHLHGLQLLGSEFVPHCE